MILIAASTQDLDKVMALIEDGRASLKARGLDQWQGKEPSRDTIVFEIEHGYTRVAVDSTSNEFLGTLAYVSCNDPDYDHVIDKAWLTGDNQNYACLHRIAVSAAATKRGVARFMLSTSVGLARQQGFMSVRGDTHEQNIAMQRTFASAGFKQCCLLELPSIVEGTKRRVGYEFVL